MLKFALLLALATWLVLSAGCSSPAGGGGGSGGGSGTGGSGGAGSGGIGGTGGGGGGTGGGGGAGTGGGGGGSGGATDAGGGADLGGGDVSAPRDTTGEGPTRSFVYASGYAAPITIFSLNTATGALTPAGTASTGAAGEPTSLAFSPDKRFVYAGDEQKEGPMGKVIAFAINQDTGALQEINQTGTRGAVTAHIGVHPSGKWVLTANYGPPGTVTVFPVRDDGGVGTGLTPVTAGGQAHYIAFDGTGKFLFVPCVAANHVAMFRFTDGVLTPNDPATVAVPGGPRHFTLTPDERFAYVFTQGQSTIAAFAHDRTTGRLTAIETVNSTTTGSLGAHIAVHPSGKFLYTSNRGDNSVSIFSIEQATGRLTRGGFQRAMITNPWWLGLDATGQLLIVANDRAGTVLVHRVDQTTGLLQTLGAPIAVAMRPTYVGILTLP